MAFDYIDAPLRCPGCDQIATGALATDLQTKIAKNPQGNEIHLGDQVPLLDDPRERDYLLLNPDWRPGGSVLRVIQSWSCPNCDTNPSWAKLTFQDGTLAAVEPVPLDAAHLAAADFITPEVLILVPLESVPRFQKMPPDELVRQLDRVMKERNP